MTEGLPRTVRETQFGTVTERHRGAVARYNRVGGAWSRLSFSNCDGAINTTTLGNDTNHTANSLFKFDVLKGKICECD